MIWDPYSLRNLLKVAVQRAGIDVENPSNFIPRRSVVDQLSRVFQLRNVELTPKWALFRPTTLDGYTIITNAHLISYFGAKRIQAIEATDIERYYQARRREGMGERTLLHHHRRLHALFKKAVLRKVLAISPMETPMIKAMIIE